MRVISNGLVVDEITSEADLAAAVRVLVQPVRETRRPTAAPATQRVKRARTFKAAAKVDFDKLVLADKPLELVAILAAAEGPMSDVALREQLQLKDNYAIAGVLGNLARQAKSCGIPYGVVVTRDTLAKPEADGTRNRYGLTPQARAWVMAKVPA